MWQKLQDKLHKTLPSVTQPLGSLCTFFLHICFLFKIHPKGGGAIKINTQSINQSKTSFNFEFVDSKIANISEENKSIKELKCINR